MGQPTFYYDLMSQPARALYIFFKLAKIPIDYHPVALRKGITKIRFFYLTDEILIEFLWNR